MSTISVALARAGDIGEPLRRFTLWPAESPVPTALPATAEPTRHPAEEIPALAPLPEASPAEVTP